MAGEARLPKRMNEGWKRVAFDGVTVQRRRSIDGGAAACGRQRMPTKLLTTFILIGFGTKFKTCRLRSHAKKGLQLIPIQHGHKRDGHDG